MQEPIPLEKLSFVARQRKLEIKKKSDRLGLLVGRRIINTEELRMGATGPRSRIRTDIVESRLNPYAQI